MKRLAAIALILLAACSTLTMPPEAQIKSGADTVTAGATMGAVLLKNDRITVSQAKSYRAILGTASGHLDVANATLLECRKKTGSTQATNPDPCAPTVASDIDLGVSIAKDVYKTLQGK